MKLRERILALMQAEDYAPIDKPEISKQLDLAKKERRKLDYELRLLLSKGDIIRIKGDRFCIPKDADLVNGRIKFRQTGSALLIPDTPDSGSKAKVIQIDAEDTGVAMHDDKVVVRINDGSANRAQQRGFKRFRGKKPDRPDGPTGRVIRIRERARDTIVGNLQKTRFFHYVVPDDPRIINDIYVPDPKDSKLKPAPKVGSKVVVKLHEWEQRHVNPEGEIILSLGDTHEPQAELMAILHKYDLNPDFPQAVIREAKAIHQTVSKDQTRGRRDMRDIFTFTIDPDDAKDFDDALSLEKVGNGSYKVGIHIADVGAYVYPGTKLDKEAHERGNSSYLVGKVIPMLPHELSNGICSLKEDVDRLTKSVFLTFTKDGSVTDYDYANTVIRSNKRLTYKQAYTLLKANDLNVARNLQLPPAHQTGSTGRALSEIDEADLKTLQEHTRKLWVFAKRLRDDRMKGGGLDLDMSETKIFVDEDGYADRLEKVTHDESHQLIEEFMLAANESVAREMRLAGLPCVYRVHEEPDEERLGELREYLATFGIITANLLDRKEMIKTLEKISNHPQSHLLKTQFLRSLKKARYTSSPEGHYGLNKQDYCHFTSPIRRYSDLVTHRVFDYFLVKFRGQPPIGKKTPHYQAAKAKDLGEHLSLTEINSTEAERESVKVKLLEFFERELDKTDRTEFAAIITEVRNHGMFIELSESNAFGLVHSSTMRDDLYKVNASGTAFVGRRTRKSYKVGQKIDVVVHRVDRFKRQVDFRIS